MMAEKYEEDHLNDGKADVNYRSPLERMLDMKDEQIGVLRQDLARKENQMTQREKETREELSEKEKGLKEMFLKKDREWMDALEKREGNWMERVKELEDKLQKLKYQLQKRDDEVHKCDLSKVE